MRLAIIIPTYNAGSEFGLLLDELDKQTLQADIRVVVDSESSDDTVKISENHKWHVIKINKKDFNHGSTRQMALDYVLEQMAVDYAVYITQDVRMPQKNSLEKLLKSFSNKHVGAAYGRQMPHEGASIYARMDREYNYPPKIKIKTKDDIEQMGKKAAFLSDSFAAYRVSALKKIGGFPKIDICEDMYVGGKLLLAGWHMAYMADAEVRHSHEPMFNSATWNRYRMIGKFQREEKWIQKYFGDSTGDGIKLLKYQLKNIFPQKGIQGVIKVILIDAFRFVAYKW